MKKWYVSGKYSAKLCYNGKSEWELADKERKIQTTDKLRLRCWLKSGYAYKEFIVIEKYELSTTTRLAVCKIIS